MLPIALPVMQDASNCSVYSCDTSIILVHSTFRTTSNAGVTAPYIPALYPICE